MSPPNCSTMYPSVVLGLVSPVARELEPTTKTKRTAVGASTTNQPIPRRHCSFASKRATMPDLQYDAPTKRAVKASAATIARITNVEGKRFTKYTCMLAAQTQTHHGRQTATTPV